MLEAKPAAPWSLLALVMLQTCAASFQLAMRNLMPKDVEIYWEPSDGGNRRLVGIAAANGGQHWEITSLGHVFSYDDTKGQRHSFVAAENQLLVTLADGDSSDGSAQGDDGSDVRVRCTTTVGDSEAFDVLVKPSWSPNGAERFLQLVREGYYDGCGLTRVVPQFLTQLGIGADAEARNMWRGRRILDDPPPWGVRFQQGTLSFAGNGKDSRTTDIFIVMPGAPPHVLANFGTNPWETPFGIVDTSTTPLEQSVVARWHSYGDMPPWGEGPNPQKIHPADGYEYLRREFPRLDYLAKCWVVEAADGSDL